MGNLLFINWQWLTFEKQLFVLTTSLTVLINNLKSLSKLFSLSFFFTLLKICYQCWRNFVDWVWVGVMMEEWECEYELGSVGWETTRRKKTELYEKEEPNVSCMKMNKKPGLLLQVSRLWLRLSLETILHEKGLRIRVGI